jgi:hypothetical protein
MTRRADPAYVEEPGDYRLWTFPPLKADLSERLRDMSRETLRTYVFSSFEQIGISEDTMLPEIADLLNDPDYVAVDESANAYWSDFDASFTAMSLPGVMAKMDTSKGEELVRKRGQYNVKMAVRVLRRWKTRVLASERLDVPVRVFTIHCPKVKAASCIYVETTSSTVSGSFDVQLFGIGAGGRAQATLEAGARYTASDGNCYEIVKSWDILAERCVELHRGAVFGDEYIRVSPIGLRSGYQKLPLTSNDDACLQPTLHSSGGEPFDLSTASDPDGRTKKVSAGLSASFKVGFDLPILQSKAEIGIEASSTTEKSLDYSLPGRNRYMCYPLTNDFGYAWTTTGS